MMLFQPPPEETSLRLSISAYRYNKELGFFKDTEYWIDQSGQMDVSTSLFKIDPFVLKMSNPAATNGMERAPVEKLLLIIRLEDPRPGSESAPLDYDFLIDPRLLDTYHPDTAEVHPKDKVLEFIELDGLALGGTFDEKG